MKQTVEILKNEGLERCLNDAAFSQLLKSTYSILYADGQIVRGCQDSLRKYYRQIEIDGIMKAEKHEEIKNRTCKPNWKGNIFVTKLHTHISPNYLTDKEAIQYLNEGILFESQFEILPDGYLPKQKQLFDVPKVEKTEPKKTEIQENKPAFEHKKKGRKPKK